MVDSLADADDECLRYLVKGDFAALWPPVVGLRHPGRPILLPPQQASDGPLKRHDVHGYVAALRNR